MCLAFVHPASAQPAFDLAGHHILPGLAESFLVPIADIQMPITVVNGARPGPVLTLTAGIHGDEFPSILALQQLRAEIQPADLSGTLVLIHLANTAGFQGRRIAINPSDGKNLNRSFPGRADGTATEQIAHFLTREVIARTDYLIDMHSGSWNEELWPHAYSPVMDDPPLDSRTLAFARATGLGHIVLFGGRPRDPERSVSYPNTAQTRGKPALTVEIGQLGQRDDASVRQMLEVARNALRHLRMLPGATPANDGAILYRTLHEVESPATGLFHPRVRAGEVVGPGALLGTVVDYFGTPLADLRAPVRGVVLILGAAPAINRGDTPVTIGEWQQEPGR